LLKEVRDLMPDYEAIKACKSKVKMQSMYEEAVRASERIVGLFEKRRTEVFGPLATSHCLRHGQQCPCCFFDSEAGLRCTVAGSTCVAWSTEGLQLGVAHPSFVVWLVFIMELMTTLPDFFVHECTPNFPMGLFLYFLHKLYRVTAYEDLCPTMGHPIRRTRQYVVGHLLATVESYGEPEEFAQIFGRALEPECRGSLFFIAPSFEVDILHSEMAKRRRMSDSARYDSTEVLTPAQAIRLQEYRRIWEESGAADGTCDLEQNEHISSKPTQIVSTLLTHSTLYNFTANRVAVGKEKLMLHGMPTYKVEGVDMVCPFGGALDGMKEKELASLAGNGMAQCIIGPLLAYILATTSRKSTPSAGDHRVSEPSESDIFVPTSLAEAVASGGRRSLRSRPSFKLVVASSMQDDEV
jgi:hypothetical protein